ncbi:hypothetical protein AGENTSMITH_206 [Bacillus phage vB_BspM_AgentSmith]|nr:hypothetical protein AGENTSMITH_206 [Bacillus phage vB_BspM_AgentSmith]
MLNHVRPFLLNRQNNLALQKELSLDYAKIDYMATVSELMYTYNAPVEIQIELGQRLFRLINLVMIHNLFIYIAENRIQDYVVHLEKGTLGSELYVSYYYLNPIAELLFGNHSEHQDDNLDYLVQVITNYLNRTISKDHERYSLVLHQVFEELLETFQGYPLGSFKLEMMGDSSPVIFLVDPTEGASCAQANSFL